MKTKHSLLLVPFGFFVFLACGGGDETGLTKASSGGQAGASSGGQAGSGSGGQAGGQSGSGGQAGNTGGSAGSVIDSGSDVIDSGSDAILDYNQDILTDSQSDVEACVPQPCANDGKTCGSLPDGCGGMSKCLYQCSYPKTCGGNPNDPNGCYCKMKTQTEINSVCATYSCTDGASVSDPCANGGAVSCLLYPNQKRCKYLQTCKDAGATPTDFTCQGCTDSSIDTGCSQNQPFAYTCPGNVTPPTSECTWNSSTQKWCCKKNTAGCFVQFEETSCNPTFGCTCPAGKKVVFDCGAFGTNPIANDLMPQFGCIKSTNQYALDKWCCPTNSVG